jgi:tetratricopeptide (TPR) repeat protein
LANSFRHRPDSGIAAIVRGVRPLLCGLILGWLGLGVPAIAHAQVPDNPQVRSAIEAYEAGNLEQALSLLQSAPALLTNRDAAIRGLYLGLVHFALGDADRSRDAFMRAVLLDPAARLDPAIHSPSRVRAFETARAIVVEGWRNEATAAEARGDSVLAMQRWEAVLAATPEDAQATERLAAMRTANRGEVVVPPPARDSATAAVEQPAPVAADPDSAATPLGLKSPGSAFALGLVVPGLGEIYAGRSGLGLLALAAAGGAVAVGYMAESVDIRCATVPQNDVCQPEYVLSETTDRPYLGAGIAVAAGIGVLAALDAFLAARRANARTLSGGVNSERNMEVLPLAVSVSARNVRVDLLKFRF